jgi:hypothetical protein
MNANPAICVFSIMDSLIIAAPSHRPLPRTRGEGEKEGEILEDIFLAIPTNQISGF